MVNVSRPYHPSMVKWKSNPCNWHEFYLKIWNLGLGFCKTMHTVSFDWFLSGLEWILNLEFCLPKLLIFYQKLLWKIRSKLNRLRLRYSSFDSGKIRFDGQLWGSVGILPPNENNFRREAKFLQSLKVDSQKVFFRNPCWYFWVTVC